MGSGFRGYLGIAAMRAQAGRVLCGRNILSERDPFNVKMLYLLHIQKEHFPLKTMLDGGNYACGDFQVVMLCENQWERENMGGLFQAALWKDKKAGSMHSSKNAGNGLL